MKIQLDAKLPLNTGQFSFLKNNTERQAEREKEAGSLLSREPDAGLDPRTLGS